MGTVPPREISADKVSDLITEGTLARPLYFYSEIDLHDTTEIIGQILTETSTDGQRENSISSERQEELTQRICRTLAQITEHYADGVDFEIAISEETLESAIREQIEEKLERRPEEVKMIVQPMLTRYSIHALRIACIMAALDECSHTVEKEHLDQAMTYWMQSFTSMLEYFSRRKDEISGIDKRAMRRQRDKTRAKLDLLIEVIKTPNIRQARAAEKLRVTAETIRKYAKELEERGAIEVHRTGNRAEYVPVENPRNGDVEDFL